MTRGNDAARLISPDEASELSREALGLRRIRIDARVAADLELLAVGAVAPLRGFLGHDDYQSVVRSLHLTSGAPWSVPVTLAVDAETYESTSTGERLALVTGDGDSSDGAVAIVTVEDRFQREISVEAKEVYRTTDEAHPGVAALLHQGPYLLGGPVQVLKRQVDPLFRQYALMPSETRAIFAEREWRTVVGFQTRNPIHRAHEYLQKVALEIVDGLFVHPLIGETKGDDVPAAVRMRCYQALLDGYYPAHRVLLGAMPAAMRYAGPREAVFHAQIRKNYGCTHFIVGRDHAGVGSYYGTYDAQRIFDEFKPGELGITPLKFEHSFYCRRCGTMASDKTCPHDASARLVLSGTKVRQMLQAGENLPGEFTRPEVAAILREAYRDGGASC
ncbi:MAG: sulfate adenylyltransferase [Chloroflexi bacterium]|nr:sulfate adenylyltransferase [Chloroflexota bacterium]